MSLTHEQASLRRSKIAAEARAGIPTGEIATKYGVSLEMVYSACRQFDVTITRTPLRGMKISKPRTFRILRDLWDGISPQRVAERNECSLILVYKIRGEAVANGWPELEIP